MDLSTELTRLREHGATGLLHVGGARWPSSIVYLMDGEIVACAGEQDSRRLERLIIDAQLTTPEQIEVLRPRTENGEDLIDLLREEGASLPDLLVARGTLFDDNMAWTLANPSPECDFEDREAVFPDHMLFDLDGAALLPEIEAWVQSIQPLISAFIDDTALFTGSGELPPDWAEEDWAELCQPRTMAQLMELLGPPRPEASMLIVEWLNSGLVTPIDDNDSAADLAEAINGGDLDGTGAGDEAAEPSHWDETIDLAEAEAADPGNLAPPDQEPAPPADADEAQPAVADSPAPETAADGEPAEDNHDRAARGDFVRSYDVLDHVDLTDVPILGAGTEVVRAGEDPTDDVGDESLPPIEMGEYEPEIEAEAYEEDEDIDGALDEPPPVLDGSAAILDEAPPVLDEDAPPITDVAPPVYDAPPTVLDNVLPSTDLVAATNSAPPVQSDSSFSIDTSPWESPQNLGDLEAVVGGDAEGEAMPAPVVSATDPHAVDLPDAPLDSTQLAAIVARIETFNSIFRIVFETFAQHLGPGPTAERFAGLLATATDASPQVLDGLSTNEDGTLSPEGLLANIAAADESAPETALHKGLYELLFNHLYDAKDLLPGEAEAAMMEQLVEYERQLHQP